MIIAGGGVINSGASSALVALAENLDAPVFTTHNGRGSIPEDHPLCVGNLYQSKSMHRSLANTDLTIAIGTRFQVGVGGAAVSLTPLGKLLHIDIDPDVIGLVNPVDLGLIADAHEALDALSQSTNYQAGDREFSKHVLEAAKGLKSHLLARLGSDYAGIMSTIRQSLPRDGQIVRDTTIPAYNFVNQLLEIYEPRTFIGPTSAAIGPGLPLSIGASVGTGRKTVVIHGDGGFMFHATEIATAVQYQLPLIICVFNDSGYGVLRGLQSNQFEGRYGDTDLGFVGFAKTA